MRKTTLLLVSVIILSFNARAQNFQSILLAKEDAVKLTSAYIKPAMSGLVYSMNGGWYHTAKVHKKLGFDITIGASASFIPSKDEIITIANLGLSNNTRVTNGVTISPTFAGSNLSTPAQLEYNGQDVTASFIMPKGTKENLPIRAIPTPSIQVGLGLPFKLEAILRYVPKIGLNDVKAGLLGIGLKKEITSWFGPLDKSPLHISLLATYTNAKVDYRMGNINGRIKATNALTEFQLNSYTIQAIASINFPIINFYGGIGYNGGSTSLNIKADSDFIATYQTNTTPSFSTSRNLGNNPLSLNFNTGSFNATIGARLSLGFFKLFGSYSLQEYNTINAGIAFSIR